MPSKTYADGIPDEHGVFQLAQAPLHFHNAVAELLDNAIAAKSEKFNIRVNISDSEKAGMYDVSVVDDCLGISIEKLSKDVFKVGKPPPPGSSYLREHGFGLKNVLAKVQAVKGSWKVLTRDKKATGNDEFYAVAGPLSYRMPIQISPSKEWPSHGSSDVGSVVGLTVPLSYMQTVSRGMRGHPPATIGVVVDFLREHIGVFYRGYLEGKHPVGTVTTSDQLVRP